MDERAPGVAREGWCSCRRRELAMQVAEATHKYARGTGISVVPVYGGAPMMQQIRALERGADIVVGTPGRVLDHIRRQSLTLDAIHVLVLDEADEMLDMGFAEDIDAILEATPERAPDDAVLGNDAGAAERDCGPAPRRTGQDHDRPRENRRRKTPASAASGLHRPTRAQGGRAPARARHGKPDVGARLLPHASGGRHAGRDAERARLQGRGHSRWHAAAPA